VPLKTEGIKYAGSKRLLIPHILRLARSVEARTVFDAFAGTSRVSQAFARSGYRVLSNDIAVWSEIFSRCYLLCSRPGHTYTELIEHLNHVPPRDGWFTAHYGGNVNGGNSVQGDGRKRPWQIHNTRKLDGIRGEIERLGLSAVDKAVAITSLMLALDRVDNTLGHFAAYLKRWSPRSYHDLTLRVPALHVSPAGHRVFRDDVFNLLPSLTADLAYLDPPYGSNNEKMPPSRVRYASYYHLWTSVCLNDRPPLFGKANRRSDTADTKAGSVFEEFRRDGRGRFYAVTALERLLRDVRARYIILSYSSGGRATARALHEAIAAHGKLLDIVELAHKRHVMSGMTRTREWLRTADEPHREYLFLIEKTNGIR